MKKKFITKLILSGAALAASAATLVSTTYAWYVQNTQVTATGVSGAVKDNGASSIYISKDYVLATPNDAHWLPTVEFNGVAYDSVNAQNGELINGITVNNNVETYNEAAFTRSYAEALVAAAANQSEKTAAEEKLATARNKVYNGGLDPITLTAANGKFVDVNGDAHEYSAVATPVSANISTYYEKDGNNNYTKTTDTAISNSKTYYTQNAFVYTSAARVIEFDLYVQANVLTTIRPYLIIKNTTTVSATTQTAYKPVALTSGNVAQGSQFWIDAVQALRMEVIVNKAVIGGTNSWSLVNDNTSNGIYDVLSIAKKSYDVTNGYTPYSPVESIYRITSDATLVTGKKYYTRTGDAEPYTYTEVQTPAQASLGTYYEKVSTIITEAQLAKAYKATADTTVVAGKTYYTQGGTAPDYTYTPGTPSSNPNTEGFYEFDTSNMGANKYYKDLTGRTPLGTFGERATPILADKMNTTKLSADTAYRFTFRIWLEGTDPACFDSCVKQTFNIGINFDVENA